MTPGPWGSGGGKGRKGSGNRACGCGWVYMSSVGVVSRKVSITTFKYNSPKNLLLLDLAHACEGL